MLLVAGGVMMFMHHKRRELLGHGEEGGQSRPIGLHGPHGHRGERSEWSKRVPQLFDAWHRRAHEQEQAEAAPAI
jgi:hypothetical protein